MNRTHTDRTRTTRFTVTMLLLLLLVVLRSTPASASTADAGDTLARTQNIISPSVVHLTIGWEFAVDTTYGWYSYFDQDVALTCSGVIVSPDGYIATAAHCVDDGPDGFPATAQHVAVEDFIANGDLEAAIADGIFDEDITFEELYDRARTYWTVEGAASGSAPDRTVMVELEPAAVGDADGAVLPARVVDVVPADEGDVALLKVAASDLTPALIEPESALDVGDPVMAVGYGGVTDEVADISLDPSFKDGRVSAMRTREDGLYTVVEHSAPVLQGMSGGPLVDVDGNVVGINSFAAVDDIDSSQFASPASIVRELLARAGSSNELTDLDRNYRRGVEAFYGGDPQGALAALERVVDVRPDHEQAQDLLADAERTAPASQPVADAGGEEPGGSDDADRAADSTLHIVPAAGVALTMLLGSGVALGLVRRRRTGSGATGTQPTATESTAIPTPSPETSSTGSARDGGRLLVDATRTGSDLRGEGLTLGGPTTGGGSVTLADPEVSLSLAVRYCGACGEAAGPQQRFCAICGTALA